MVQLAMIHPISTANRYHASELPQREYDPEKAAEHYKSGHSGTIQLSAANAAFGGGDASSHQLCGKPSTSRSFVSRMMAIGQMSNKKGWCVVISGRPTEDWMFTAAYTDDTEWNDTAWKDRMLPRPTRSSMMPGRA